MKNIKSLLVGSFLVLALGLLSSRQASASVVARSPKEVFVSTYSTSLIPISPTVSTSAAAAAAFMPGAVYEVFLSTGAGSEYFELYDSTTTAGITCGAQSNGANQLMLTPKILFGSTTVPAKYTFDPPILFHNGLVACDSAITGSYMITYELGRGLSGQ